MIIYDQGPTGRVFSISGGFGSGIEKKSRLAGWFGSGRSVEIFYRVFPGILFIIGYFQEFAGNSGYFRIFSLFFMSGYTRYFGYTQNIGYT